MIVGFTEYTNEDKVINFNILMKKSPDFPKFDRLHLNITNSNKTEKANCKNGTKETNDTNDLYYSCQAGIGDDDFSSKVEVIKRLNFSNASYYEIMEEDDIELSSLANETIKNIINIDKELFYDTFFLDDLDFQNGEFILKGVMNSSIFDYNATLNLSSRIFDCFGNQSFIIFEPNGTINDNLYGKMANISDQSNNNKKILIYSTDSEYNSIIYPIQYKESFAELIGFGGYQKLNNKDATSSAYFRGTPDVLSSMKNYMQFTALLTYEKTNLRNLEQDKMNITAIGLKRNNNDIIIYDFTFMNTSDKTIIDIKSNNDYLTSDTNDFSGASPLIKLNIISTEDINILNNDTSIPQSIEITIPVTTTSNSFSFGFKVNESLALEKNITASYLNYPSPSGNREEYECSLENKIYYYLITCSPKTDIYTLVRNVRIKVPEIKKSLRFLAEEITNRTLIPPADSNEIIDFQYNPDINTYGRRISKNKALSPGAIAAIVLASIAAIVAVGIAIFFLNRMPTNPPVKPTSELQLQNSSAKIQN